MVYIYLLIAVVVFIYIIFIKPSSNEKRDGSVLLENKKLPYCLKDNFLSPIEYSFYKVLEQYIEGRAIICPKVGLKEIFFVRKDLGKKYMRYFQKISQKHVDFLLCEPITMKPICGIELDDSSHTSKKSYERDLFVEKLYNDTNFPLVRFSAKSGYTLSEFEAALNDILNNMSFANAKNIDKKSKDGQIIVCPKCQVEMILRKASKGERSGREFYGCPNFPNCREILNID